MSGEPTSKKPKFNKDNKSRNYHNPKANKRQYIEAGHRGFLATCNFREKDCVRECYNILNQYADELYGAQKRVENNANVDDKKDDNLDITDALQAEINASKAEIKENKFRFQVVDTGTTNCIFVKTVLPDPVELGLAIVKDIAEKKVQKSRYLLRLVPIEIVCKANIKDIVNAAGQVFDKYFLKEGKTFSIVFNKRYNNDIKRDDVIKELADLVMGKNVANKVDLKNAQTSVIVEVIKGLCCLSVVEDYLKFKKYNLVEIAAAAMKEGRDELFSETKVEDSEKLKPEEEAEKETKSVEDENVKKCE